MIWLVRPRLVVRTKPSCVIDSTVNCLTQSIEIDNHPHPGAAGTLARYARVEQAAMASLMAGDRRGLTQQVRPIAALLDSTTPDPLLSDQPSQINP
jgi:hypothetical protein